MTSPARSSAKVNLPSLSVCLFVCELEKKPCCVSKNLVEQGKSEETVKTGRGSHLFSLKNSIGLDSRMHVCPSAGFGSTCSLTIKQTLSEELLCQKYNRGTTHLSAYGAAKKIHAVLKINQS